MQIQIILVASQDTIFFVFCDTIQKGKTLELLRSIEKEQETAACILPIHQQELANQFICSSLKS
jgi:hypothetical protein